MTCTICRHPDREGINAALIAGEPYRRLAARTGTTTSSLRRHKAAHLPLTLTKAVYEAEVVVAMSLLEQVQVFQAKTLSILAKAEAAGDFHIALLAIREGRANAELLERCLEKERAENLPAQRLQRIDAENSAMHHELFRGGKIDAGLQTLQGDLVRRNQLLKATHKLMDLCLSGATRSLPTGENSIPSLPTA